MSILSMYKKWSISMGLAFLTINVVLFSLVWSNNDAPVYPGVIVSEVVSVYDGDTLTVNIDEWPAIVGLKMKIRILGIDTPEIRGSKCDHEKDLAYEAKQFVIEQINDASVVSLVGIKRGKYFRILADVQLDGVSLSGLLQDARLAVTYSGGKKTKDWCST